jgi:hypothetical protein
MAGWKWTLRIQRPARGEFNYTDFKLRSGVFWLAAVAVAALDSRIALRQGWTLRSSAEVWEAGSAVSSPGYRTAGWRQIAEAKPADFSDSWHLRLEAPSDDLVSENFHWLSAAREFDYGVLQSLPAVELKVETKAKEGSTVKVTNPGKSLAFAVRLKLTRD